MLKFGEMIISNQLIAKGHEYAWIERRILEIQDQNRVLEMLIIQRKSIHHIDTVARSLGFVDLKDENIMYIER